MIELFERYRFVVVVTGVAAGLLPAFWDVRGPGPMRRRSLGLCLAAAAVVTAAFSPAGLWFVAAGCLCAVPPSDELGPGHPLGPLALVLGLAGLAGIYVSVPDVEAPLALAACLVPITVVRLGSMRGLSVLESGLLVVSMLGVTAVGVGGRWEAMAPAAAVGMVLAAPLAIGWVAVDSAPRTDRWRPLWSAAAVVVTMSHLLLAVPVGRLVMRAPWTVALGVAASSFGVQLLVAAAVARAPGSVWPRRDASPGGA